MRIEHGHGIAYVYGNERPRNAIWFVTWGSDVIRCIFTLASHRAVRLADRVPDDVQ